MTATRIDIEGVSVSPDHYIGGRRVASVRTFENRSPLDWSLKLGDFARGDAGTAEQAVAAAAKAFPNWSGRASPSEPPACTGWPTSSRPMSPRSPDSSVSTWRCSSRSWSFA